MVLLYSLFVALFIVSGQALWKIAVMRLAAQDISLNSMSAFMKLILSAPLLVGVLVYGIATLAYIYLLGKYNYYQIQSVVVGGSLIITALVAHFLFREQISLVGVVGIILIFAGVLLVTR